MKDEKIIWKGQPKYKARWAFLEIFGGGAEAGPFLLILPIIFVTVIFGIYLSIQSEKIEQTIALSVLLLIFLFGPEFHKSIRRKNTEYILTNKELRINDYWYGKTKKHIINLSNVDKFYLVNYKDDCGEIHIFTKTDMKFSSRNFMSGSKRPTLALEDIENAKSTFDIFNLNLQLFRDKEQMIS